MTDEDKSFYHRMKEPMKFTARVEGINWDVIIDALAQAHGGFEMMCEKTTGAIVELGSFKMFIKSFSMRCDPKWRRASDRALKRSKRNVETLKKQGRCR